jgi:hypothetical protein
MQPATATQKREDAHLVHMAMVKQQHTDAEYKQQWHPQCNLPTMQAAGWHVHGQAHW